MSHPEFQVPALRIEQSRGRYLYTFGIDGKVLGEIAAVSRVRRGEGAELSGYQRPEVLSHIGEIRTYIESDRPMIPNALVVAFDQRVRFEPIRNGCHMRGAGVYGTLHIPAGAGTDEQDKPGWVVDGQQRLAAIRDAAVKHFPVVVVAFIAEDDREQREQFILVNSTKPLPKGLIYELLPTTDARLASGLQKRRFPATLLNHLNHDRESPFYGRIHTPTNPDGAIKDNSVLRLLENSLTDGALYMHIRGRAPTRRDVRPMVRTLNAFWTAVREAWPEAWDLPPRRSRLVHGAGIVALGFVMDAIVESAGGPEFVSTPVFKAELESLCSICRWTGGTWRFGRGITRKWNELQNTSGDIQLLADYLLRQYSEARKVKLS